MNYDHPGEHGAWRYASAERSGARQGAASALGFLEGGRTLGALMRAHDWSATPIGPPAAWPQSLRTAVSIALNSRHPMFVAWGAELTFLYNDAYAEILGAKHPAALGRRFRDIWSEIWPDILPLIERALGGEATWSDDLPLVMARNGYMEETYFTFSYSPIRDESGGIGGMFCAVTETTGRVLGERRQRETAAALRASEEALREERDRLYALFTHAPGFVAALDGPEHRFVLANDAFLLLVGGRAMVGKTVREALPDIEGQGFFERLDRAYASGQPFVGREVRIVFRKAAGAPPEEHFVDFVYQPVRERDGSISGIFVQGTDVTERVRAAAQQRLLLDELSHRVKNNLAAVQSIAAMTARGSSDMGEFLQAFLARLSALARAHDLLARNAWQAMDLHTLLSNALDAFGARRVVLAGPPVTLDARQSLAVGLMAHELATNAAKYGALSQAGGRVEIGWAIPASQRRLEVAWTESGGPPVRRPERRGFGTRLIERSVRSDLGGEVALDWRPDGLRCAISVPLAGAAQEKAAALRA